MSANTFSQNSNTRTLALSHNQECAEVMYEHLIFTGDRSWRRTRITLRSFGKICHLLVRNRSSVITSTINFSFPQNTWAVLGCTSQNFVCVLADALLLPGATSTVFFKKQMQEKKVLSYFFVFIIVLSVTFLYPRLSSFFIQLQINKQLFPWVSPFFILLVIKSSFEPSVNETCRLINFSL
jgi:hypothetical protein